MRRRRPSRRAFAVILATLTATACLWTSGGGGSMRFPHDVHVTANGLACTLCHAGAETADRAGLPTRATCQPCHGHEGEDSDRPAEATVPRFFDAAYTARAEAAYAPPGEVRFSHRAHVQAHGMDCAECHGDVGHSGAGGEAPAITMQTCIACHTARGKAPEGCDGCHTVVARDWPPPSHGHAWIERHGAEVRFGAETSANRCTLCHDQASGCFACHARTAPRDHTHYWRLRGHGAASSIDRDRCSTCHTRDSCDSCHQETRPLSHAAGFGGTLSRHCTQCHFPLAAADGCATCHRGTPDHDTATPMPFWHLPSMNCRQCHGVSVRLPHADGGHVCTTCHR